MLHICLNCGNQDVSGHDPILSGEAIGKVV